MLRAILRADSVTFGKKVYSVKPSFGKNVSLSSRSNLNVQTFNIERIHSRSLLTTSNESIKSQLRRERIKKMIRLESDPEAKIKILNDRLGCEFETNWEFNRYGVTPSTEAYRNLHTRGLLQRISGKTDANKAIYVELKTKDDVPLYKVGEEGENTISPSKFSRLAREIQEYLSDGSIPHVCNGPELYMHDGAIGSDRDFDVPTRIITDSPNTALFAKNMLPRKKLTKAPLFTPTLVVLEATGFHLKNPSEFGLKSSSFGIFDPQSNRLYIAGSDSLNNLQSQIISAVTLINQNSGKEVVTLSCDSLVSKNGNTSLIFSPNQLFLQQRLPGTLFGAHHHFLSKEGLSHAWSGVQIPSLDKVNLRKGDLVTKLPDGSSRAFVSNDSPNIGKTPSQIIFLVNDTREALPTVYKLSPSQACQQFMAGYNGSDFVPFFDQKTFSLANSDQLISTFKSLTEKTESYLVSTNSKGKQLKKEDLASIFDAIQNGKGSKSKTGVVKNLEGVKELNSSVDDKLKKLEQDLLSFISSKFPNTKV